MGRHTATPSRRPRAFARDPVCLLGEERPSCSPQYIFRRNRDEGGSGDGDSSTAPSRCVDGTRRKREPRCYPESHVRRGRAARDVRRGSLAALACFGDAGLARMCSGLEQFSTGTAVCVVAKCRVWHVVKGARTGLWNERRPKPNPDPLGPPHPHGCGGNVLLRPLVWFLSALDRPAVAVSNRFGQAIGLGATVFPEGAIPSRYFSVATVPSAGRVSCPSRAK